MMIRLSLSRHSISSGPPGSSTVHCRSIRPSSTPATTVAQAPVPHARVMPAPRSHTRMRTRSGASTSTNSVLVRAGNTGWFSNRGPTAGRSRSFTLSVLPSALL